MTTALIKINGSAGSRSDLILSSSVTLTNNDDTGVISWSWTLLSKPPGSIASLSTPGSASSSFIPDIVGSYLIRLVVSDGSANYSDRQIGAILTTNLGMRIPASTESNEFNSTHGWADALHSAMMTIDAYALNGINAIHKNVSGEINSITSKSTLDSSDIVIIEDSSSSFDKKKVTVSSLLDGYDLKASLYKSKISSNDTTPGFLQSKIIQGSNITISVVNEGANETLSISGVSGTDGYAIHTNVSGEINGLTSKTSLVDDDMLVIEDFEDGNSKKKVSIANLLSGSQSNYFNHEVFEISDGDPINTVVSFGLRKQPIDVNNSPTGFAILVFRQGVESWATGSLADDVFDSYVYDSGSNEVWFKASEELATISVIYWSADEWAPGH